MRNRLPLYVLLLSFSPIASLAQYTPPAQPQTPSGNASQTKPPVVCPWLTEGTAARMLGGDVSVTANVSESGEGVCKFARLQDSSDSLEIVVSKAAVPGCAAGSTQLRGIGNEATMCKHAGPHGESIQMVSSRVRDQHFTVTITAREHEKAAKVQDAQDEPIARIAEQVAGSLF